MREWLTRNKVWFETIAALLLSLMAIVVACQQTGAAERQNKLVEQQNELVQIQTKLAEAQFEREVRQAQIQRTAHWQELRDGLMAIDSMYPWHPDEFRKKSKVEKLRWFRRINQLLNELKTNPVLIEHERSLGHWRNAMALAQTHLRHLKDGGGPAIPDFPSKGAYGIHKDVGYVWAELVLDSGQISATGGRPPPEEEEEEAADAQE